MGFICVIHDVLRVLVIMRAEQRVGLGLSVGPHLMVGSIRLELQLVVIMTSMFLLKNLTMKVIEGVTVHLKQVMESKKPKMMVILGNLIQSKMMDVHSSKLV